MTWIYDIPTWLFGLLCVVAFVGIGLAGLFITYRRIHKRLGLAAKLVDNGVVGWFFSGVLVLYGVTLGLIAVATWGTSAQVSGVASQEAASISALYRDLSGYPQPAQADLRQELRAYTQFIIGREWPAQRQGRILDGGTLILDTFQTQIFAFEPTTEGQKIVHAEALRAFNLVVMLRRQRIDAVSTGMPGVLWAVVLLGGLFTIVFSYCFYLEDIRLHVLLSGGLALMIGLLVFQIAAMDHPYRGEVSVSSDAYQIVLDHVMNIDKP